MASGLKVEKKPKALGGVIDRYPVQQDERLVRPASAYVEPAADIGGCLDSRQQLQAAQQIGFHQRRHLANVSGLQRQKTRLQCPLMALTLRRDHDGLAHIDDLGLQLDVEPKVRRRRVSDDDGVLPISVTDVDEGDDVSARRYTSDGVVATGVCRRSERQRLNKPQYRRGWSRRRHRCGQNR